MESLVKWTWPGNIRELENAIERAVILSKGSTLSMAMPVAPPLPSAAAVPHARNWLADAERVTILDALRRSNGVLAGPDGAAARLGVKRTTLQAKIRKLGIVKTMYK
jgi:formate hydrogenlyase transcriptional activator